MTSDIKDSVQRQFGNVAEHYSNSVVHQKGADLDKMLEDAHLTGAERVLDAGTGTGHTALAFAAKAAQVVAVDLTREMLAQGQRLADERGITNVQFERGDVEALPYADGTFDLVTSRYCAHHYPHPEQALAEFARVLKPGGVFLLSDITPPEDHTQDTFLNTIELIRDPSHVRDHRASQWVAMLEAAGFDVTVVLRHRLRLDFEAWVTRMATPPESVNVLKALFDGAPDEVRNEMAVEENYAFTLNTTVFRGVLR